jgi:hypothetical protein
LSENFTSERFTRSTQEDDFSIIDLMDQVFWQVRAGLDELHDVGKSVKIVS